MINPIVKSRFPVPWKKMLEANTIPKNSWWSFNPRQWVEGDGWGNKAWWRGGAPDMALAISKSNEPHLVGGLEHYLFSIIYGIIFSNWLIFFRGVETTKQPWIEATHNCRHLAWFSIVNLASQLGRYSSFPKTMLNYSKYHASGETRWLLRKTRIPIGLASHNPCLLLLVFLAQGRPGHHDDEGSDCAMAG